LIFSPEQRNTGINEDRDGKDGEDERGECQHSVTGIDPQSVVSHGMLVQGAEVHKTWRVG